MRKEGRLKIAAVLFALGTLSGCVNRLTANISPGADLKGRQNFHVIQHAEDSNGVGDLITGRLVAMGYQATIGPEGSAVPAAANVTVTYIDKWMWDMTMYLMELTITLKDAKNDFPLASGNAFHGSLTRRSPTEMVEEVLTEIFKSAEKQ